MEAMSAHANSSAIANATMAMILSNITVGPSTGHHHHHNMGHNMSAITPMPGMTGGIHHMGDHAMAANSTMVHDNGTHMGGSMDHGHHGQHKNNSIHTGSDTGHGNHSMTNGTIGGGHDGHGGHGGHDGHGDGSDSGHSVHAGGHMMTMTFNFDLPLNILFIGWRVTTQGQLAGACIAWFILAIVHEGLKGLRESILTRSKKTDKKYRAKQDRSDSFDDANVQPREKGCLQKIFNGWHILLSILQIIQTTLGMFLMLVYMTFNVYLAIAVSIGSGVGYWLFAWNRKSSNQFDEDHCV